MKTNIQSVFFLLLLILSNTKMLMKQAESTKLVIGNEIKEFSVPLAKYFVKLASFAYCLNDQISSQRCCPDLFTKDGWILAAADFIPQDNYNFAILRHDQYKKIVVAVPGTRDVSQLLKEMQYSGGVSLPDNPSIKIMSYFYTTWTHLREKIIPKLKAIARSYPDYQIIFTGHSLGGAMATILAWDSVRSNIIKKTATSPLLITYGQPRTGNDVFANDVMKNVSQVYRVVRNGDIVASLVICPMTYFVFGYCKSVLKSHKFDSNLILTPEQTDYSTNNFYTWGLGGMRLFNADMSSGFTDCGISYGENHSDPLCDNKENTDVKLHTTYFDIPVGSKCFSGL
jgi:hypothetical protein